MASSPLTMGRFRAVFLDVGGTLLTMGRPAAAYRQILAGYGHSVDEEQIREWVKEARVESLQLPPGRQEDHSIVSELEQARRDFMIRRFLERVGLSEGFDRCHQEILDSWLGTTVFAIYDETRATLAALKQAGLLLGVVSNWEPRLPQLCHNQGIAPYLDFVLSSEAEGHAKPSPVMFQRALELAQVSPGEALHVGDSLAEDVEASRAQGITAVLIQRDGERTAEYSPMIRSLEQLVPLATADAWIQGQVVTGAGEAVGFTQIGWVLEQFEARLGFRPYPGTLNLRPASSGDLERLLELKAGPGVPIEPEPGYCAARCYPLSIEGRAPGALIVPLVRDYPPEAIELLAAVNLRQSLELVDEMLLTLAIPQAQLVP